MHTRELTPSQARWTGLRRTIFGLMVGLVVPWAATACDRLGDPHTRGERYLKRGEYEQAVAVYTEAIDRGHNLAIAYANRCYAYENLNQYEEAIHDCTESLKLQPDDHEVLNNRGVSYLGLRRVDEAIADFDAAIAQQAEYPEAYANRGRAYISLEDYDRAIEDLTWVIEYPQSEPPALAEAYGNRGLAYESLGDDEKAIADYGQAIELTGDPQAYFNRGMLHYTLGYFDKAYDDFTAVVGHADPNDDLYFMAKQQAEFLENRPKGFDPRTGATAAPTSEGDAVDASPTPPAGG